MKAVVFHGVGDIRLDDVAEPKIKEPTDAIVRLTASAICGTDLHMVRGTLPGMKPGTILGHEGVGVVEPACLLVEAAEEESIPYTVEATGRSTGTDADVVQISRSGVPTGLVQFPLRYMHSPVEVMQLDDVQAAARLIAAFALRLATDASFVR